MWKNPTTKATTYNQPNKDAKPKRRGSKFSDSPYLDVSAMEPPPRMISHGSFSHDRKSSFGADVNQDYSVYSVPLYDNRKRTQASIKEKLADVTQRLNKTLFAYDALSEYEQGLEKRKEVVKNTRGKLQSMQNGELKNTIESLLVQDDRNVSENTIGALNQRDDLLYELADWFSGDHSDLDSMKMSIDEEEESEIEKNYNSTFANFEKLKRVQHQMKLGKLDGKKMMALEREKKKLESAMINNVKEMKAISIQCSPSNHGDRPPPWKDVADQICDMLSSVRREGSEEATYRGYFGTNLGRPAALQKFVTVFRATTSHNLLIFELIQLSSKMTQLLKELNKQQQQIKSLQSEIKREKKVIAQLTDENTDQKVNIEDLQVKNVALQRDIDTANQEIEKLLEEKGALMKKFSEASKRVRPLPRKKKKNQEQETKKLRVTLSGILEEFLHDELPPHASTSDLEVLKADFKDHREALKIAAHEIKRLEDEILDLETEIEERDDKITALQDLHEKLGDLGSDSSDSLATDESTQSAKISIISVQKSTASSVIDDKVKYYQKTLADTELRLSDAYKEISALRHQLFEEQHKVPSVEKEEVVQQEEPPSLQVPVMNREVKEDREMRRASIRPTLAVPPPSPADIGRSHSAKETKDVPQENVTETGRVVHKGYSSRGPVKKLQPKTQRRVSKLPPIPNGNFASNLTVEEELPDDLEMPEARSQHEEKLWKLGDLQGRMSQLMTEILQFVKMVGDMIFTDQNSNEGKLTMQTFDFDKNATKKEKAEDPKVVEGRRKKSEAFFLGQKAVGCLKDAYEILSSTLTLQHDDFELIYRAFKNHQYQRRVSQAVIAGQLPLSVLQAAKAGKIVNLDSIKMSKGGFANGGVPHGGGNIRGIGRNGVNRDGGLWRSVSESSITSDASEGHKANLDSAVMVLGIHRSKSEVDVHSVHSNVSQSSSQIVQRELSHILYPSPTQDIQRERRTAGLNREETRIPTTKLPKKGLIKLTALDHEMQDPTYYDKHREDLDDEVWTRKKPLGHISDPHKHLMNKSMMGHIKEGARMLAQEEKLQQEHEAIEKQLGEYTIGDLHQNLNDLTNTISKKKSEELIKTVTKSKPSTKYNKPIVYNQKKIIPQPVERNITLPSIKDFSFG